MKLQTTRFGEITVDEDRMIEMKGSGIFGFERLRRFVLILHKSEQTPFLWFQSVEDGAVAFVVMNAFVAMPDYAPAIGDGAVEVLGIDNADDVILLAIVTIGATPLRVTANLKAPLVVHAKRRWASQVVVEDPDYPIRYDLALRGDVAMLPSASVSEAVKGITTAIAG